MIYVIIYLLFVLIVANYVCPRLSAVEDSRTGFRCDYLRDSKHNSHKTSDIYQHCRDNHIQCFPACQRNKISQCERLQKIPPFCKKIVNFIEKYNFFSIKYTANEFFFCEFGNYKDCRIKTPCESCQTQYNKYQLYYNDILVCDNLQLYTTTGSLHFLEYPFYIYMLDIFCVNNNLPADTFSLQHLICPVVVNSSYYVNKCYINSKLIVIRGINILLHCEIDKFVISLSAFLSGCIDAVCTNTNESLPIAENYHIWCEDFGWAVKYSN